MKNEIFNLSKRAYLGKIIRLIELYKFFWVEIYFGGLSIFMLNVVYVYYNRNWVSVIISKNIYNFFI